jgi:hypothetical protein
MTAAPEDQKAPKRRKVNNLAQSLGRMAHVKNKTVALLKTFEKQVSKESACSIHFDATPPACVLTVQVTTGVPTPVLASPSTWWAADAPNLVNLACSFCASAALPIDAVFYNPMLACPYVLACSTCTLKN